MDITQIYKALADETRLRIVGILAHCSLNVQELQKIVGCAQSNISHHLRILETVGILKHKREGTWNFYSLTQDNSIPHILADNFLTLLETGLNGQSHIFLEDQIAVGQLIEKRRDEARAYFDSVAPKWQDIRDEIVDTRSYLTKLKAEIPSSGTLLEMGCGSGILLGQLLPRGGDTIGVDYSPAMLKEAESYLKYQNVDLRLGYLEHLPISDSSIDVALCHMVLHHLTSPKEALEDAYRVLKPDGRLIVIDLTPHTNEKMRERYADRWLGFEPQQFSAWAQEAGFRDLELAVLGKKDEVFLLKGTKKV